MEETTEVRAARAFSGKKGTDTEGVETSKSTTGGFAKLSASPCASLRAS